RLQAENDLAARRAGAPSESQQLKRLIPGNCAGHVRPLSKVCKVGRRLLFLRQITLAEMKVHPAADPAFDLSGSEPLAALFRIGQILPNPFDWAWQEPVKRHLAFCGEMTVEGTGDHGDRWECGRIRHRE